MGCCHRVVFSQLSSVTHTQLRFVDAFNTCRDVLACSRLCVGYVMEFETFGNVELSLSTKAVRRLEVVAEQRERAAIAIQKVERGRQSRRGLTTHHTESESEVPTSIRLISCTILTMFCVLSVVRTQAAIKIQSVERGRLARSHTKEHLERYRQQMVGLSSATEDGEAH